MNRMAMRRTTMNEHGVRYHVRDIRADEGGRYTFEVLRIDQRGRKRPILRSVATYATRKTAYQSGRRIVKRLVASVAYNVLVDRWFL